MSRMHETKELRELLLLSQSGEASERELAALNEMLRRSPTLVKEALEFLEFDAMLHEGFEFQGSTQILFNKPLDEATIDVQLCEGKGEPTAVSLVPLVPDGEKQGFSNWALLFAVSVLAASVLFAIGWIEVSRFDIGGKQKVTQADESSSSQTDDLANTGRLKPQRPKLFAMVTFESNTRWTPEVGPELKIGGGEVTLSEGIAKLSTRDGVVLTLDAREFPVKLQFDSDRFVTVSQGTVMAKATESALGFSLRTPTTRVIDIGTEFAVSVGSNGESDVSVLEGAVTCLPSQNLAIEDQSMFVAGQTVRFRDPTDQSGLIIPTPEAVSSLQSTVGLLEKETKLQNTLFVYEGFSYSKGTMKNLSGGMNWKGQWHTGGSPRKSPAGVIRTGELMNAPSWMDTDNQQYSVLSINSKMVRKLATPVSLQEDRDLYVSFIIRRQVFDAEDTKLGAGFALVSSLEKKRKFAVSIGNLGGLTTSIGAGKRNNAGRKLKVNQTYLIVAKMSIRATQPDVIKAKAFSMNAIPQASEPFRWDNSGMSQELDGSFDSIRLWCGQNAIAAFDEIRIGNTWSSVVPLVN